MRWITAGLVIVSAMVALSGCTKKETTPRATEQTPAAASSAITSGTEAPVTSTESAVAPEINPPGDIPDSQAFVRFTSPAGGYSLEVPEGWARSEKLLELVDRRLAGTGAALVIATHDAFVASRMKTQWTMDHGVLR